MTPLTLTPTPVQGLEIFANPRDALRDLFAYLEYLRGRRIKRMVRTNGLPAVDITRLCKQLALPETMLSWLDFIERLALSLNLVYYDVKGSYRGYNSSERTFPDNYVKLNEKDIQAFLGLSPAGQEKKILDTLNTQHRSSEYSYSSNEFFQTSTLGRLDRFSTRGSAIGVVPTLDFVAIRHFLLGLLRQCEPGVWYSTASLVAFLKTNHPYFLIPKEIPPDRWGKTSERYYNFQDGTEKWFIKDTGIPADAPDAFERVEGRYIERFLEGIPLELRFVEVAYRPAEGQSIYPSLGRLPAFRVTERFLRLMKNEIHPPRITVQPNFEIIVEAELYPAGLMQTLTALAEEVSAPGGGAHASVTTLQLKKERIAAEQVRRPDLDVIALLGELSSQPLPPNVITELNEWSGHADQFTLYDGFDLLECAAPLPRAAAYTVEHIHPPKGQPARFQLVRHADKLVAQLEKDGLAPLWIQHTRSAFELLPEAAQTLFPRQTPHPAKPAGPTAVSIRHTILVTLHFAGFPQAFDDFRKALAEARCPIQADAAALTITFPQAEQPRFEQVRHQLAPKYRLEIADGIR